MDILLAQIAVNWTAVTLQCAALLVLVLLSATFSGSETVLFSLTRTQLEQAGASSNVFRRAAAQLLHEPRRTLATILVANTAVNVLLFATSYVLFARLSHAFGAWVQPVAAVLSVMLVVVVGEVVPKVVGVALAERLAPFAAAVVQTSRVVADPIVRVVNVIIVEPFMRLVFGSKRRAAPGDAALTDAELKTLLEMSRQQGVIRPLEDTLLRSVIDLERLRVRDVMVPRVEMVAYDVDDGPVGLRELMRSTRFKKIPVYAGTLDQVLGLIYAKVLYFNTDKTLRELIVPARFVPELITCGQLLHHFRQTKTQLAIAVDEFGGVAGLVTLEDVLEAIVGELHDPEDVTSEPEIVALPDGQYEVSGQLSVHYWVQALRLPPLAERVATVGGLVVSRLGRPAVVGDVVRLGNVELTVTRVAQRRVGRLRLRLLGQPAAGGAA